MEQSGILKDSVNGYTLFHAKTNDFNKPVATWNAHSACIVEFYYHCPLAGLLVK